MVSPLIGEPERGARARSQSAELDTQLVSTLAMTSLIEIKTSWGVI